MGNARARLKTQSQSSITKVFKAGLDDMELILATIEAMIDRFPEINQDGAYDFLYVKDVYAGIRKHILGVGNDEIRKMNKLIDSLDIEVRTGYEEIIFFNN